MEQIKFYDTCALLDLGEEVFKDNFFYISSITLNELENIKTSRNKDEGIKYKARKILNLLIKNVDKFKILSYKNKYKWYIKKFNMPDNDDSKILICAYKNKKLNLTFVTADLACATVAKYFLNMPVEIINSKPEDEYTGFKKISIDYIEEVTDFYTQIIYRNYNRYNLLENEYLLLEQDGKIIDSFKWTEGKYKNITPISFKNKYYGTITPKDAYQTIAMDSLKNNTITLLGGQAGSGKTYLALSYLLSELEKDNISKIIIFVNPVGARGAGKLGFYKGTVREKLLSTQVGHVLASKLGSIEEVERLLDQNLIEIIPAVDARGYETPDSAGVYILESQNLTSDLLRMLLQRVGNSNKVIVDGDRLEQTDMEIYSSDNGMKKMSEVFRGHSIYGQVDLQTIYRSEIATIAEQMKK